MINEEPAVTCMREGKPTLPSTMHALVAVKPILGELPVGMGKDVVAVDGDLVTIIVEAIDEVETA